jgi:prepilin-type N-terminal cleavage/methylation domain-containing protein
MTHADCRRPNAFTLVELLVVVIIIGLLAGLILPTYFRIRAVTRSMLCSSNLRLQAQAHAAYSNLNNDNKPPHIRRYWGFIMLQWVSPNTRMDGKPVGQGLLVDGKLLPFEALLCPSFSMMRDSRLDTEAWDGEQPMAGSSYAYFWRHRDSIKDWSRVEQDATYIAAKHAGRTALSMDINAEEGHSYGGEYEGRAWESHPTLRRVHVSYMDGAVRYLPSDEVILKAPGTPNQSLEWFDKAHRLAP